MAKEIQEGLDDIRRRERLWRAQEAKILKVLNMCRVIKRDDNGIFAAALDKVCGLLETRPALQSLLIMQTLKDVITEAELPAICGRAAQCRNNTDWSTAKKDLDFHHVALLTADEDIVRENTDREREALVEITFQEPFASSNDSTLRGAAVKALMDLSLSPVGAQRIRDIFTGAASDESLSGPARAEVRDGLEKIVALQDADIRALADNLAASPVAVRPRFLHP
jgi:hypothetical protein